MSSLDRFIGKEAERHEFASCSTADIDLVHIRPWLKSPSAVTPSTRPAISPQSAVRRPPITLIGADLGEFDAEFAGKNVVLNIFPSVDTPTCATSVRQFNERAAGMDETVVVCVSADLPFAMGRFCGAEGIENVKVGSTFRSDFGSDYGVTLTDGVLQGVLARAVVVIGPDGTVKHTELVAEIAQEPNYEAALAAL